MLCPRVPATYTLIQTHTRCLLLFNPLICFLWTFLHRRSHTSASTHLNVTRLVVFISLCSACGRKISTFKLTKHERCFTQLMSGIYGLCSHETMWGIIHIICTVTNRDWEHDTLVRFSFSVYLREIIFVYLSNITPFWLSVFPWPPALNVLLMFTESSVVSGHQTVLPTLRPMQNISGLSERTVLLAYECK